MTQFAKALPWWNRWQDYWNGSNDQPRLASWINHWASKSASKVRQKERICHSQGLLLFSIAWWNKLASKCKQIASGKVYRTKKGSKKSERAKTLRQTSLEEEETSAEYLRKEKEKSFLLIDVCGTNWTNSVTQCLTCNRLIFVSWHTSKARHNWGVFQNISCQYIDFLILNGFLWFGNDFKQTWTALMFLSCRRHRLRHTDTLLMY